MRERTRDLVLSRPCVPSARRADRRSCATEINGPGKGFATLECYQDLEALEIPENAGILLECVMNLTANESYREERKRCAGKRGG